MLGDGWQKVPVKEVYPYCAQRLGPQALASILRQPGWTFSFPSVQYGTKQRFAPAEQHTEGSVQVCGSIEALYPGQFASLQQGGEGCLGGGGGDGGGDGGRQSGVPSVQATGQASSSAAVSSAV